MATPEFPKLFFLAVDASDEGAGAVLLQLGADEVLHPIFYFSNKFNNQQLAVQHFEVHLGAFEKAVVCSNHDRPELPCRVTIANQRLMR